MHRIRREGRLISTRGLTEGGATPPTVSILYISSKILPLTFPRCNHGTSTVGRALDVFVKVFPTKTASLFPRNLGVARKSQLGEIPPAGFVAK